MELARRVLRVVVDPPEQRVWDLATHMLTWDDSRLETMSYGGQAESYFDSRCVHGQIKRFGFPTARGYWALPIDLPNGAHIMHFYRYSFDVEDARVSTGTMLPKSEWGTTGSGAYEPRYHSDTEGRPMIVSLDEAVWVILDEDAE